MSVYDKFVQTANRLIEKYGREITLQKLSSEVADAQKPWKGSSVPTIEDSLSVKAVFVSTSDSDFAFNVIDDELLKRADEVALFQPIQEGLETYNKIIDSTNWKIMWFKVLKPADKTVLYMIGVSR